MEKVLQDINNNIGLIKNGLSTIESSAKQILECVKNDSFISDEIAREMINALEEHLKLKCSCGELYNSIEEKNCEYNSIQELEDIIKKLENESVKKLAAMFYALHSNNEEIEKLLDDEKKRLDSLFEKYNEDENIELLVKDYIDFADAVNRINDLKPEEILEKMNSMKDTFGNDLTMHAFISRDIFVDENYILSEKSSNENQEKKEIEKNVNNEEIDNKSENNLFEESDNEDEDENNRFIELLLKNGAIIPDTYEFEDVEVKINPKEDGKVGAKSFRGDVSGTIDSKLTILLIRRILMDGCVSPNLLKNKANGVLVDGIFSYLYMKGYLRSYSMKKIGEFYCASRKLCKATGIKDVRNLINLRDGFIDDGGDFLEANSSIVFPRIAYSDFIEKISFLPNIEGAPILPVMYSEGLCAGVYSKIKTLDLFISIACTNEENVRGIEDKIEVILDKNPDHIFIASVNEDYAKRVAKSIVELWNVNESIIYIYNFRDVLISYSENKDVTFDEIYLVNGEKYDDSEEVIDNNADEDNQVDVEDDHIEENSNDENTELEKNDTDNLQIVNDENNVGVEDNSVSNEKECEEKKDLEEDIVISKKEEIIDVDKIMSTCYEMINSGKSYCALSYLYSYKDKSDEMYQKYRLFAYAINDPLKSCRYSSTKMYDVYLNDSTKLHDYLFVAASLRTFFYNHVEYDYAMKQLYESNILSTNVVNECKELKNVFRNLVVFKETIHKGVNEYADYKMKENVELENKASTLKKKATDFYEEKIKAKVKESAKQRRFVETKKIIFNKDGDISEYLQVIINEDKELYPFMKEYVCETFMKEGSEANIVNIDNNKMDIFIDEAWKNAGKTMRTMMKSSDLMSSLRGNLRNAIVSAISIMCEWISISNRVVDKEDDEGIKLYKKNRNELLSDLKKTSDYLKNSLDNLAEESDKTGCIILTATVDELARRIEGSYSEEEYKYFYIDFLRSDKVLLNDEYIPVMDMTFTTPKGLGITDRIYNHYTMTLGTFENRLEEIFLYHGDDYGSAKLIIEYLGAEGEKLVEEKNYDLEESISYGKRGAQKDKQDFVENLELMQSYGQIDNTVENKKDKYLQISNSAYDFCYENNNFGFYRSVIEAFINQIKEDSKQFKYTLENELDECRKRFESVEEDEKILEKLNAVQDMIDIQNYTVAQDLLTRITEGDFEADVNILPEDYLEEFIDEYEHNVSRTADSGKSLINVVAHRLKNPKNKDSSGGRKLIENWPLSGNSLDKGKLRNLLKGLGFNVGEIDKAEKIGRIDNYNIKLNKPKNGRKINYKHPIAAFGSLATEEGFRVAFISGKTDSDRLIEAIKDIGYARNTIIIVDYAIDLKDRRKLARRIKALNPPKVFAVIDRVTILYLAENYNEAYINQMLMSIIMPFSYVQPFVWDSGNVMPAEMFMGRDKELKEIESPTGINIVYGGRQLGKSALLKMARKDIDRDEDGRRAVYVDIKGKDYKKAVKSIGRALFDEGVLYHDFEGDSWDDLAREIKNRLRDENKKIPYLLLLLDEADTFIASCEDINFEPLDALKDIQNVGTGRFKFVIAGLRNIVKFTKGALANNSVLTHLGCTTITPFKYTEARELLEKPLYYLGLRFTKERESLVSLIFANANYFPGLIQLYCAKLVEAMTKGDYAGYNQNDVPIYIVEQEHIKKVLAEEGFLQQVREKFEITLKLDEDNYYYIIALLLASLYHDNGYSNGYSADDILKEGQNLGIEKIADIGIDKLIVFLDELCELNVLRRISAGKFVFNRYSFFQMMGSREEVDNKILECMEE